MRQVIIKKDPILHGTNITIAAFDMRAFDTRLSPLLRHRATDRCLRYAAFAVTQAARHRWLPSIYGFRRYSGSSPSMAAFDMRLSPLLRQLATDFGAFAIGKWRWASYRISNFKSRIKVLASTQNFSIFASLT
jgi:hypothetical protein